MNDVSGYSLTPSKISIENALNQIKLACKPGDSVFFYYCGHGSIKTDTNILDNVIIPSDYKRYTCIETQVFTRYFLEILNTGARVWGLFDCCHTDSMIQTNYLLQPECIYNPPPQPQPPQPTLPTETIQTPVVISIEDVLSQWAQECKQQIEPEQIEPEQIEPEAALNEFIDQLVTTSISEAIEMLTPKPITPRTPTILSLPECYVCDDWRSRCKITIRDTPTNQRYRKTGIYIMSGYVPQKNLGDDCKRLHNTFTRCFIDTVSNMCSIQQSGLYKFIPQLNVLEFVEQIDCRLRISGATQRASLSIQCLEDIDQLFDP